MAWRSACDGRPFGGGSADLLLAVDADELVSVRHEFARQSADCTLRFVANLSYTFIADGFAVAFNEMGLLPAA